MQRLLIHPVITVHNLKILSTGIGKSGVDRVAMPSILFIDYFDYIRILVHVLMGNLRSFIFRTIIYNNNLYLIPARQDAFNGMGHVILGIIAWDSK